MIDRLPPRWLQAAAVLWTLGILVAVTLPGDSVPDTPSVIGFDKIVHFVMFAGFGTLWMEALSARRLSWVQWSFRARFGAVLTVGAGLAVGTELIQYAFLESRHGDVFDVVANLLGLMTALAVMTWRHRRTAHARSSR